MTDMGQTHGPPVDRFLGGPPPGCLIPVLAVIGVAFCGVITIMAAAFGQVTIGVIIAVVIVALLLVAGRALSRPRFVIECDADGLTLRRRNGETTRVQWGDVTDTRYHERRTSGADRNRRSGLLVLLRGDESLVSVQDGSIRDFDRFVDVVNRATPHLDHIYVARAVARTIAGLAGGRVAAYERVPRKAGNDGTSSI